MSREASAERVGERRNFIFFFSSRRRHTRFDCDWSSDVCSSDLFRFTDSLSKQYELVGNAVPPLLAKQVARALMRHLTRKSRSKSRAVTTGIRREDRKSTRLNSSHSQISYAVFCLKKKIHLREHY